MSMGTAVAERPAYVTRAAGMVAERSDCTCAEALAMIEARAVIFGQSVDQIATAVVERDMRFRYGSPVRSSARQATTTRLRPITLAR